MTRILNSFYAKLSVLFLMLIIVLGGTIAFLSVRSSMQLADEAEQKLNRDLATNLAGEFQPFLIESIDQEAIREKISYMMIVNPRIEIYLLGSSGMIKASFLGDDKQLEQTTVDTAPLEAYMAGAALPIWGEDPAQWGRKKPFSVAEIVIMGEEGCYLYIILGSEQYDSAASMMRDSYIVQATLKGLALAILVTAVVGVILFGFLTRRLRGMKDVVGAFAKGKFDRRIEAVSDDEIGELAVSFNQMADTIEASVEELRSTDRLRRELIANVSHDLRSPLAVMQGYLETIIMKGDTLDLDERQRYMDVVFKNTRYLNTLVSELFELSKLDAHQIEPAFEGFSIAELVQDLVMQYEAKAAAYDVRLDADLPDQLSLVYADIGLVERAISNLIDNAIRYTPPGGSVRVTPMNKGDAVCVRVADTGYGIPEEDLPHIFERFYRVEKSRSRDKGGTGLGLAIARKIMELHGTTLEVKSALNQGTTFSFQLPAFTPSLSPQVARR